MSKYKKKENFRPTKDLTLADFLINEKVGKVEITNHFLSEPRGSNDSMGGGEVFVSCKFVGKKEHGWALSLAASYVIRSGYSMVNVISRPENHKSDEIDKNDSTKTSQGQFFIEEGLVVGIGDEPGDYIFVKVVVDPEFAYFRLSFSLGAD